jgi:hypothetical protein
LYTGDRFHQTWLTKQKDASAQHLAKKIVIQFHQQNLGQIFVLKFAKRSSLLAQFVRKKNLLIMCK